MEDDQIKLNQLESRGTFNAGSFFLLYVDLSLLVDSLNLRYSHIFSQKLSPDKLNNFHAQNILQSKQNLLKNINATSTHNLFSQPIFGNINRNSLFKAH